MIQLGCDLQTFSLHALLSHSPRSLVPGSSWRGNGTCKPDEPCSRHMSHGAVRRMSLSRPSTGTPRIEVLLQVIVVFVTMALTACPDCPLCNREGGKRPTWWAELLGNAWQAELDHLEKAGKPSRN